MKYVDGGVTAPKGFKASGVHCGLRANTSKKDLALIYSETEAKASAVYTQNKVFGAPITVTREHLKNGKARAVIINSGNANTCNADGVVKAEKMTEFIAEAMKISKEDVLVASTGVIGQPLNIDAIEKGVPELIKNLSYSGSLDAATAILTTDTVKKEFAIEVQIDGKPVKIGYIAKGSGMIHPNMATLLGFITTDISISEELLSEAFKESVNYSLNRVSIDGDTSTNDMVIILANGLSGNKKITSKEENYYKFLEALKDISLKIAKLVAFDGEGATKLIECKIKNAKTTEDAVKLGKSVIMSSLVKCAVFGNDANWGRILCALGYSGVDFSPEKVDVKFAAKNLEVPVCEKGSSIPFSEELALEILKQDEVIIEVNMNDGIEDGFALGCDLTYDYVKINGSYRT